MPPRGVCPIHEHINPYFFTHPHRNWGFYSFNELFRENDNRSGLVPDQYKKDLKNISVQCGNGCFDEHGQEQALDL